MDASRIRTTVIGAALGGLYLLASHQPRLDGRQLQPVSDVQARVAIGHVVAVKFDRGWSDSISSVLDFAYDVWPHDD